MLVGSSATLNKVIHVVDQSALIQEAMQIPTACPPLRFQTPQQESTHGARNDSLARKGASHAGDPEARCFKRMVYIRTPAVLE